MGTSSDDTVTLCSKIVSWGTDGLWLLVGINTTCNQMGNERVMILKVDIYIALSRDSCVWHCLLWGLGCDPFQRRSDILWVDTWDGDGGIRTRIV